MIEKFHLKHRVCCYLIYLLMRINTYSADVIFLPLVRPGVGTSPQSVAFWALEFAEHTPFALIRGNFDPQNT